MEWSQQGSHRHFDELKLQLLDVIKADIEKFSIEKFSRRTSLCGMVTFRQPPRSAKLRRQIRNYSESVDALGRAIAALKKQAHDRKQPLKPIPDDVDADEGLAVSADAYEFQSGGVIDA